MQLLEHEGKRLLAARGVAIPRGGLASTADEAAAVARTLGPTVAVKAQVPTGGRGKAGAIRLVAQSEAGGVAADLLGSAVKGCLVQTVLVEEALELEHELYVGIAVDPRRRRPVLLVSRAGGIDVEAEQMPIARVPFSSVSSLQVEQVTVAAREAGIADPLTARIVPAALALAEMFRTERMRIVEVNPLGVLGDGTLVAADVRVVPSPGGHRDSGGDDDASGGDVCDVAGRSRALGFDIVVLDPDGDVGLITTGAGASMMLVDLLGDAGMRPINFCDVRTGSLRGDTARLELILETLNAARGLRAIAVNVFAGVTDLEEVGRLLLVALERRPVDVPLVVRLEGRGATMAQAKLAGAGLELADSLEDLVARVGARVAGPIGVAR